MNRNDFLGILGNSDSFSREVISEIYDLIGVFPWFHSAHLLLLKGLQDNADVRFQTQLRNSAIHIADREVLYNLLNRIALKDESVKPETGSEAAGGEGSLSGIDGSNGLSVITMPENALIKKEEDTLPQAETEPGLNPGSHENNEPAYAASEPGEGSFEQPGDKAAGQEPGTVPSELLQEDDSSDTHQTVIENSRNSDELIDEIERETMPPEEMTEEEEAENSIAGYLIDNDEEDYDESPAIINIQDEEEPGNTEKIFYMYPGIQLPEKSDLLELDTDFGTEESHIQDENDLPDDDPKKIQFELIDKFIIANPRIEASRDRKDMPEEDRSKPVYDEGGFVTETLARIYTSQGYYSRAIDIYEKLSLKFPEKSSYFATQIEKVKELLKK